MKRFKKRSYFKKVIFSWPAVIGFGVLVGFMSASVFKVYFNVRKVALNQAAVKKETENLGSKKGELDSVLKRLETPAGVEEEIHKKFQVKKPGEEALIIVEKPEPAGVNQTKGVKGFFKSAGRRIWELIFK